MDAGTGAAVLCTPAWEPPLLLPVSMHPSIGVALPLMDANVSPSPFVFIWCQPVARGDAARTGHAAHPPRTTPGTAQLSRHGDAGAGAASATKTSQ